MYMVIHVNQLYLSLDKHCKYTAYQLSDNFLFSIFFLPFIYKIHLCIYIYEYIHCSLISDVPCPPSSNTPPVQGYCASTGERIVLVNEPLETDAMQRSTTPKWDDFQTFHGWTLERRYWYMYIQCDYALLYSCIYNIEYMYVYNIYGIQTSWDHRTAGVT